MVELNRKLNYIAGITILYILISYSVDAYLTKHVWMHALLALLLIIVVFVAVSIAKSDVTNPKNNTDLLDLLDIGVCILDDQGRIAFLNRKALTIFRSNNNCKAFPNSIAEALSIKWIAEESAGYQMTCLTDKHGKRVVIEYTTKATLENNEKRYLFIMRDTTQRIEIDAELAQYQLKLEELVEQRSRALALARDRAIEANEEKNTLIANMTHELRTPLNAILGYCELLQDDVNDNGHVGYLADLGKIHQSAQTLTKLINNVLDIQEVENGETQLEVGKFDMKILLTNVINDNDALIKENQNSIKLAIECEQTVIEGDEHKISKIMHNLVNNAAKFTKNGNVTITLRTSSLHQHEYMTVTVKDNGIGIDTADLDMIFKKFAQVDSSTTRSYNGAGLGLAVSKKLAQIMGGDITVESRLDLGSLFTLKLPLDAIKSDIDPALIRLSPPSARIKEFRKVVSRILIVDSNPLTHTLLCRYLAQQGFYTASAIDFADAKIEICKQAPHVVLFAGEQNSHSDRLLIEQIRNLPEANDIPIVYVAGDASDNLLEPLGIKTSLSKPIVPAQLDDILSLNRLDDPTSQEQAHVLILNLDEETTQSLDELLTMRRIAHTATNDLSSVASMLENRPFKLALLGVNYERENRLEMEEVVELLKSHAIAITFVLELPHLQIKDPRFHDLVAHFIDSDPLTIPDLLVSIKQAIITQLREKNRQSQIARNESIKIC